MNANVAIDLTKRGGSCPPQPVPSFPTEHRPFRRSIRALLLGLVATRSQVASTVARIGLGVMIFPHGAQKLLGWFGGYGFAGTVEYFTQSAGLPWILAVGVVLTEFFGGVALVLGLGARLAALGVGTVMTFAALLVHRSNGFFANWEGNQAGEGVEFHLLAVSLAWVILIQGAGSLSVDRWFTARR